MAQNIDLSQYTPQALIQRFPGNNGLDGYARGLIDLKKALDTGKISVSQYLKVAKPLANRGQLAAHQTASSGSEGASAYTASGISNAMQQAGFTPGVELGKMQVDLGQKYETQLREELIPANVTGEAREKLLKDIPLDIGFDTDRFAIEREGIRQRLQTEEEAAQAKTARGSALDELAGLLNKQADEAFDVNRAGIMEDLNSRGLLRSSAVGKSFADERARQKNVSENIIAAQSISDRDADINALVQAGAAQRGFQSAGLQREFGLEDLTRSQNLAMMIAEMSKPQAKGKTSGEKWAQGATAAAPIIAAGAKSMAGGGGA